MLTGIDSSCPICGGPLCVIGSRKRKYIETDGSAKTLVVRRLRCRKCRKIHHELPDILIPYKRHSAQTIENIIDGRAEETPCEDSTIRKILTWWADIKLYLASIVESLKFKYGIKFSALTKPRDIVRAACNANLWIHTRSAFSSG